MANKINVKLILELHEAKLSRNAIDKSRHMSCHSVSDVINIAKEKGITYSDVRELDESQVYRMFFPDKFAVENLYEESDYDYVHSELRRTGVTLKILWDEYKDQCVKNSTLSMGYTKYCEGYRKHTTVNNLTVNVNEKVYR